MIGLPVSQHEVDTDVCGVDPADMLSNCRERRNGHGSFNIDDCFSWRSIAINKYISQAGYIWNPSSSFKKSSAVNYHQRSSHDEK